MNLLKIAFIDKYGYKLETKLPFIPQIGQRVDILHNPLPKVSDVIIMPNHDSLKRFDVDLDTNAIVTLS